MNLKSKLLSKKFFASLAMSGLFLIQRLILGASVVLADPNSGGSTGGDTGSAIQPYLSQTSSASGNAIADKIMKLVPPSQAIGVVLLILCAVWVSVKLGTSSILGGSRTRYEAVIGWVVIIIAVVAIINAQAIVSWAATNLA